MNGFWGDYEKMMDHFTFKADLKRASESAGRDLAVEDDLMARFTRCSVQDQMAMVECLNCYIWSAFNLDVHFDNIFVNPEGQKGHAGHPGDSSGISTFMSSRSNISLPNIWRLVQMDGARPVHVKADAPLPESNPGERLIAGIIRNHKKNGRDFHFMARGSSGLWSNVPGHDCYPSFHDADVRLIHDPRLARFHGQRETRVLFFSVPQEGLSIAINPSALVSQFNLHTHLLQSLTETVPVNTRAERLGAYMDHFAAHVPIPSVQRRFIGKLEELYRIPPGQTLSPQRPSPA